MNRNRVFDDLNHVNDESTTNKRSRKSISKQWFMSKYKSFRIKNDLQYDLEKLSESFFCQLYSVFGLFFIEKILETLIENTNRYASDHSLHDDEIKFFARQWYSTTVKKLRVYIITCIYMRLHFENRVKNYWNNDNSMKSLHILVIQHIALVRWQQIDRFFHIFEHSEEKNVYQKINHLSEHLRQSFKIYWIAKTHLTVDETIQRFMNRASETVNIFSKSVFENFKIWILINAEYVMNWMYHAKDETKNSVDLNEMYTKEWRFSKTQTMIFDLLQQHDISDDFRHIVWLNNLFTSARLLSKLIEIEFEDVDTVRTTKTRREMLEIIVSEKIQKSQSKKEKNKEFQNCLAELKTEYDAQLNWNTFYEDLFDDDQMLEFAWKNQQVMLFMSIVSTDKKTMKRMRKRFAKIAINAKTSRIVFDDMTMKKLIISEFIDLYNHFMNDVDVANQLRSYYNI